MDGLRLLPLLLLLATAVTRAEPQVSFSQGVLPVLMRECSYCHMREERYGYLVIDPASAYQNLVGTPARGYPLLQRVEPGDPGRSYLWLKLTGKHLELGGEGWPMPFFPLPESDMQMVRLWIEQGARDN